MSRLLSLRDMRAWRRATAPYRDASTDPDPIDVLLDIAEAAEKSAAKHYDRDLALALAKLGQDGTPAMSAPTHAFIGYSSDGTPLGVLVDDGERETSHAAVQYIKRGGRIERMLLEDARKVRLYERPAR